MAFENRTGSEALLSSARFQNAKKELIQSIVEAGASLRGVKPGNGAAKDAYRKLIDEFTRERGRDLYFPFVSSGLGSGPFVELCDGGVKYDMITGIGINFFGHSHPELISEMLNAMPANTMQGNLQPGHEAAELIHALLTRVGPGSRLAHGWLIGSGTMSNEIALKIIRQRKQPATKILAFRDCFAGRSTAMQEITDNPSYRQGQPVYGEVEYLPFYDSTLGLEQSVSQTLDALKGHLARHPDRFAALMIELVQGEGGFKYAPRDFYVRVFEEARKANLAIWVDEIQTFGRTGELFAFRKFDLASYVDVVTVGKMLQVCGLLFTDEYNPKPGLVAGTFSGSTVGLRTGRRVIELLEEQGFLGKEGKIERLSSYFVSKLRALAEGPCKGMIGEIRAIGGMIGFVPFQGTADQVKAFLMKAYDLGLIAFYCGHGPHLIRLLPPLGAMNEKDVDDVCELIGQALREVA